MSSRTRNVLLLIAALVAAMFALPAAATAAPELAVLPGYDDSFAPNGATLYEGSAFDAKVLLEASEDASDDIELVITWDDRRSYIDVTSITWTADATAVCSNRVVAPGEGSAEGFDVITCAFDPDFTLLDDSFYVTIPITPTAGTTANDWTDPLVTYFTAETDPGNASPSLQTSASFAVQDRAVSDLATTLTGSTSVAVPAGGAVAGYTATVTNNGPAATPSTWAYFLLPQQVKVAAATAGGLPVTCVPADQSSDNAERGLYLVGCPSGSLAVSASRVFTVTLSLVPGAGYVVSKPLALPLTYKVEASAGFSMMDYIAHEDLNPSNDFASVTTAATVPPVVVLPCPAGKVGTPPNCVDAPKELVGTSKAGTYVGGTAADVFRGGIGNETFKGGAGNDTANGGKGNDKLFGDAGNDKLSGGLGNDVADGGLGNDVVNGDSGNDTLKGGAGKDKLNGGAGNDKIDAKDKKPGDVVTCGAGKDTVVADAKDKVSKDCEKVIRK